MTSTRICVNRKHPSKQISHHQIARQTEEILHQHDHHQESKCIFLTSTNNGSRVDLYKRSTVKEVKLLNSNFVESKIQSIFVLFEVGVDMAI